MIDKYLKLQEAKALLRVVIVLDCICIEIDVRLTDYEACKYDLTRVVSSDINSR